jgi:hypothetical protein
MLTVHKSFMDETGIQRNDPYCTIAGYVGTAAEWERFSSDWRFVLQAYMQNIPPNQRYFHALEFYGNDRKYKNWTSGKRNSFMEALFSVINDYDLALFSGTVDSRIFFLLSEDERRYLTGGIHNGFKWKKSGGPNTQYYVPFHFGIIQPTDYVPEGDKLFPTMSRQDQYEINALQLYEAVLNSEPPLKCRRKLADEMVFSDPKSVAALQAADLATYWMGRLMTHRARTRDLTDQTFPHRLEMRVLLKNVKNHRDLKLFNCEGLMLLLQGSNCYTKTSFPTRDQLLPSLPAEERRRVLDVMRKANFRRFLDRWQPGAQEGHGYTDTCPFRYSGNPVRHWLAHPSQPGAE